MDYSFKNFEKNAVIRFLALDKYEYLLTEKDKCNVSKNKEYQRIFNKFFMVRRDEKWRNIYYDLFEKIKNDKDVSFKKIVKYMYEKTGNIEASFSTKMLAIINPNMPIWDQYIINNLELKVEGIDKEDRLNNTIQVYDKIIEIENELLKRKDVIKSINDFKKEFSEFYLTDIKILDYLLWNTRENN